MGYTFWIWAVIIIGVAGFAFIFYPEIKRIQPTLFGNPEDPEFRLNNPSLSPDETIPEARTGGFGGSAGGGSGGGSSSGGDSSSGGETGPSCPLKQVSYSIGDLAYNSTCLEYEDSVCVRKSTQCSAVVYNYDSEVGGTFVILLKFFPDDATSENPIDTVSVSREVNPLSTGFFNAETETSSSGEDGNANKNIFCSFASQSVPVKEVC